MYTDRLRISNFLIQSSANSNSKTYSLAKDPEKEATSRRPYFLRIEADKNVTTLKFVKE
jgi:hypothetical protein